MAENINWDEVYKQTVGSEPAPATEAAEPASQANDIDWSKAYEEIKTGGIMSPPAEKPYETVTPESQYVSNYLTSFGDINLFKAYEQPGWHQFGNALSQFGVGTVLGLMENIGYLGDVVENVSQAAGYIDPESAEGAFDNALSRTMREWREDWEEEFPIYRTNPNKVWDMGDFGWWMQNGEQVVESISEFLLTGYGVGAGVGIAGKGISALGRGIFKAGVGRFGNTFNSLTRFGAKVNQAGIQTSNANWVNSLMTSQTVAAMNSVQAYESIIQDFKDNPGRINPQTGQPYTDQEVKTLASIHSAGTYKTTAVTGTLLNLTTLAPFTRNVPQSITQKAGIVRKAKEQLGDYVKRLKGVRNNPEKIAQIANYSKNLWTRATKPGGVVWEAGQEGVEEVTENLSQDFALRRAQKAAGEDLAPYDLLKPENTLAFVLGMAGGVVGYAGKSGFEKVSGRTPIEMTEKALDAQINTIDRYLKLSDEMNTLSNQYEKEKDPQKRIELEAKIALTQQKMIANAAENAVDTDTYGVITEDLERIMAMSDEEAEAQGYSKRNTLEILAGLAASKEIKSLQQDVPMPGEIAKPLARIKAQQAAVKTKRQHVQNDLEKLYKGTPEGSETANKYFGLQLLLNNTKLTEEQREKYEKELEELEKSLKDAGIKPEGLFNEAIASREYFAYIFDVVDEQAGQAATKLMNTSTRKETLAKLEKEDKKAKQVADLQGEELELTNEVNKLAETPAVDLRIGPAKALLRRVKQLKKARQAAGLKADEEGSISGLEDIVNANIRRRRRYNEAKKKLNAAGETETEEQAGTTDPLDKAEAQAQELVDTAKKQTQEDNATEGEGIRETEEAETNDTSTIPSESAPEGTVSLSVELKNLLDKATAEVSRVEPAEVGNEQTGIYQIYSLPQALAEELAAATGREATDFQGARNPEELQQRVDTAITETAEKAAVEHAEKQTEKENTINEGKNIEQEAIDEDNTLPGSEDKHKITKGETREAVDAPSEGSPGNPVGVSGVTIWMKEHEGTFNIAETFPEDSNLRLNYTYVMTESNKAYYFELKDMATNPVEALFPTRSQRVTGQSVFSQLYELTEAKDAEFYVELPGIVERKSMKLPSGKTVEVSVVSDELPKTKKYYKRRDPNATYATARDIYATDPRTGNLLVNTPLVQEDMPVVIVAEPEFQYWISENEYDTPLQVYLKEDIDEATGRPMSDARPLGSIPLMGPTVQDEDILQIREHFSNSSEPLEMIVQRKLFGEPENVWTRPGVMAEYELSGLLNGYYKIDDRVQYRDDFKPVIGIGFHDSIAINQEYFDSLPSEQQVWLGRQIFGITYRESPALYMIIPNAKGDPIPVRLQNRRVTDEERRPLNAPGELSRRTDESFGNKNFWLGDDFHGIYKINTNISKPSGQLDPSSYKKDMLNFTGVSVIFQGQMPIFDANGNVVETRTVFYEIMTRTSNKGVNAYENLAKFMQGSLEPNKFVQATIYNEDGTPFNNAMGKNTHAFKLNDPKRGLDFLVDQWNKWQVDHLWTEIQPRLLSKTDGFTDVNGNPYDSYLSYVNAKSLATHNLKAPTPYRNAKVQLASYENPSQLEAESSIEDVIPGASEEGTTSAEKAKKPVEPKPKTPPKGKEGDLAEKLRKKRRDRYNRVVSEGHGLEVINDSELNWFKQTIGEGYLDVVESVDRLLTDHGQEAWGYYENAMATIAREAAGGTAYHEGFHLVFDLGYNEQQRQKILREARKRYADEIDETTDDRQLEEMLADDFMVYMMNPNSMNIRKGSALQRFYQMIKNFINYVLGRTGMIDTMFRRIATGDFKLRNEYSRFAPAMYRINAERRIIFQDALDQEAAINHGKFLFVREARNYAKELGVSMDYLMSKQNHVENMLGGSEMQNGEYKGVFRRLKDEWYRLDGELQERMAVADPNNEAEEAELLDLYAKRDLIYTMLNNWDNDNKDPENPRYGVKNLVIASLRENGYMITAKEYIELQEELQEEGSSSADTDQKSEFYVDFYNENDPTSKDHFHDRDFMTVSVKERMALAVRRVMSMTPRYQTREVNGKLELVFDTNERGNPIGKPKIAGDELYNFERFVDFDQLYEKLAWKLADTPFDQMMNKLRNMAEKDPDVLSFLYEVETRIHNRSHWFASFMSHFNKANRRYYTATFNGDGTIRLTETSRNSVARQLQGKWSTQALYNKRTDREIEVDPEIAKEIRRAHAAVRVAAGNFQELYSKKSRELSRADKETRTKELGDLAKKYARQMALRYNITQEQLSKGVIPGVVEEKFMVKLPDGSKVSIMEAMGIEFPMKSVDELIRNQGPVKAISSLSRLFHESYRKEKTGKTNQSVESMITRQLSNGEDAFSNIQATRKLANFLAEYQLESFNASFVNGANKTIYGINLTNYTSDILNLIKDPGPDGDYAKLREFINEKLEDPFYGIDSEGKKLFMNAFLKVMLDERHRENFEIFLFDTIKERRNVPGRDFANTSYLDSLISRLTFFHNNNGEYALINTGTKGDKKQSYYMRVPKLEEKHIDVILRNTFEQEAARIRRMKNNPEAFPDIKNYKSRALQFHFIPELNNLGIDPQDLADFSFDRSLHMITGDVSLADPGDYNEKAKIIKSALKAFKERIVKEEIDNLVKRGVLTRTGNSNADLSVTRKGKQWALPTNIFPTGSSTFANDSVGLYRQLSLFFLNDFAWNMEYNKVLEGDPAFYKNVTDHFKRKYETITPGWQNYVTSDTSENATHNTHFSMAIIGDQFKYNNDTTLYNLVRHIDPSITEADIRNYATPKNGKEGTPGKRNSYDALPENMDPKRKRALETARAYREVNKTDGQAWCTIKFWRELHKGLGMWEDHHENIYQNVWGNPERQGMTVEEVVDKVITGELEWIYPTQEAVTRESLQAKAKKEGKPFNIIVRNWKDKRMNRVDQAYLEPIKPFYYGLRSMELKNGEKLQIPEQIKASISPLIPEVIKNHPEQGILWQQMSQNNIDLMAHDSAVKLGTYGVVNPDSNGKYVYDNAVRRFLPYKNLRMPQFVQAKESDMINQGTQPEKIIIGNLTEDQKFKIRGRNFNGRQVKELYNLAWSSVISKSSKKLRSKLGLKEDWRIPDDPGERREIIAKLRSILEEENTNRNRPESMTIALDLLEADFRIGLDFPAFGREYEKMLVSLFRNGVLRQKRPGMTLAQVADFGTAVSNELGFISFGDGGPTYAEVAVPYKLARKILPDIKPGIISEADQKKLGKALDIIGYRVPTQGKSHILPMRVVEILPDYAGSHIRVPGEITTLMGSDFDIDKMFLMLPALEKGKVAEYSGGDLDAPMSMSERQLHNLILDLHKEIITHPDFADEFLTPLSSDPLKALKKDLGYSDAYEENKLINSTSTNLYFEELNKFAKQAVGLSAQFITAQTMYGDANVYIQPKVLTNILITEDPNLQDMDAEAELNYYHQLGNAVSSDGVRISDNLKVWNNAALDNASEPILGYLNVNNMTLGSALTMSAMGFSNKTVVDFLNQPIIKKLYDLYIENGQNLEQAMDSLKTEYPAIETQLKVIREAVKLFSDPGERAYDILVSPQELSGMVVKADQDYELNNLSQDELKTQVAILHTFQAINGASFDVSKANSILSVETSKTMRSLSGIENFLSTAQYLVESDNISFDDAIIPLEIASRSSLNNVVESEQSSWTRVKNSPVPRVTAFFEYGVRTAYNYLSQGNKPLFPYLTESYLVAKRGIATAVGARGNTFPIEISDKLNAHIGYALLTRNNRINEILYEPDRWNWEDLLFNPDKSFAREYQQFLRKRPKLAKLQLLQAIEPSPNNDNSIVQLLEFNNNMDRSPEARDRMTRQWLTLLADEDPEISDFAKKLVAYSVITSGFRMGPNTFSDLVPPEFWNSYTNDTVKMTLSQAWNEAKNSIHDYDYIYMIKDQIIRMTPEVAPTVNVSMDGFDNKNKPILSGKDLIYKVEAVEPTFEGEQLDSRKTHVKSFILTSDNSRFLKTPVKGRTPSMVEYVKIWDNVRMGKRRQSNSKYSGWRLYKLVEAWKTGEKLMGKYQEVPILGQDYRYVEADFDNKNPRSKHPKYKDIDPIGTDFFENPADPDEMNALPEGMQALETRLSEITTEKLKNWVAGMGIRMEAVDALKTRLGGDAVAAADMLNGVIRYNATTEYGLNFLPEEVAHFFVEGLQDERLMQRMMDRVEETEEYKQVLEQYSELYNNDELKLKKEAIGKIIAKYIFEEDQNTPSKNWLKRWVRQIKEFIQKLLGRANPFRTAAKTILENDFSSIRSPFSGAVYYSLADDIYNEGNARREAASKEFYRRMKEDRMPPPPSEIGKRGRISPEDLNSVYIKLRQEFDGNDPLISTLEQVFAERADGVNMSFAGIVETRKLFGDRADKVTEMVGKIRERIRKRVEFFQKTGKQAYGKNLEVIDQKLQQLDDIQFIHDFAKTADKYLPILEKLKGAVNIETVSIYKALSHLRGLRDQIDAFSSLEDIQKELSRVIKDNGSDEFEPLLLEVMQINNQYTTLRGELQETIYQKVLQHFQESVPEQFQDEVVESFEKMEEDLDTASFWFLSMSDMRNRILSIANKDIKIMLNRSEQNFMKWFRGTEDTPGATAVNTEFVDKYGSDLEKAFDQFVFWHDGLKQWRFINAKDVNKFKSDPELAEKWRKLSEAPEDSVEKKYYRTIIEPYIEYRQKLIKRGLGRIIGNAHKVPTVKKAASQENFLSAEWARRKFTDLKDMFKIVGDEDYIGAVDEEGKRIKYIPYRYNSKMNKEDVSMDITTSISMAMKNMIENEEKMKVLPILESVLDIMAENPLKRTDSQGNEEAIKGGDSTMAYRRLKETIDQMFYGEYDARNEVKKASEKQTAQKPLRAVVGLLRFLNLGFNVFSQIVNPIAQAYFIFSHAVGGRNYSFKDLLKGYSEAYGSVGEMLADYHSKNPKNKNTLLMEMLGVFHDGLQEIDFGKKGNLFKDFITKMGFLGYKAGNAMVQPGLALTMMKKRMITMPDGSQKSLYDIYTAKDGRLVAEQKAIDAMGGQRKLDQELAYIQREIRRVSDNMHLSDKGLSERYWWGKFVMMHRNWMVPMFSNLWGAYRKLDPITGRPEAGFLRQTLQDLVFTIKGEGGLMQLKNLVFMSSNIKVGETINPFTGKAFTQEEADLYKANVKQAVLMVYTLTSYIATRAMLPEDKYKNSQLYYIYLRSHAEILSMIDPRALLRIAQSPTAAVNNLENLFNALYYTATVPFELATDGDVTRMERGYFEGMPRVLRYWRRFMPWYARYDDWQRVEDKIRFMERYGG